MLVYSFKVALAHQKRIYRNIEILSNQTLHDLHEAIFTSFDRYDEHLYSFYLTFTATKSRNVIYDSPEYSHPMAIEESPFHNFQEKHNAEETRIGILGLSENDKLYYIFDFGDEWWHELTVLEIRDIKETKGYPKIIKKAGQSPDQYPEYNDDYE
jgi:hypothetical protein